MSTSLRPLVAGVAALGLLLPASAAMADDSAPVSEPDSVEKVLADLPVPVSDVTDSDSNLRSTRNEVSVLVTDADGSADVVKLRTETAADVDALVAHLDDEPGVVAAPTTRMAAMALTSNPEPMAGQQWNLDMIGAPTAWPTTTGAGITVAVIDTGVDPTHPDLAGHVLPEIDLMPDVDPIGPETTHGTRIASLIAGSINGAGMAGVAPDVSILPVAALDETGAGDSSTVAAAIIAAADAGAKVINLSLGGPGRDPVLDQACLYAWRKGVILVAAGGNSYQFGNFTQYPAGSPYVVAVASVDSRGNPSTFSNTGSYIDLAGPGEDVVAAVPGNAYDTESGTSFSAPHVAATLALVAAANPDLSASQIVRVAELTAQDDVSGNGRDDQLGYGIVRADRAVATAMTMASIDLSDSPKLRLTRLNASPEPARRGAVTKLKVKVRARFEDGVWRADPIPTAVRIQFRPAGRKGYRTVGEVASRATGKAVMYVVPSGSGTWRAKVRQENGTWKTSAGDYLKVLR